MYLQIRLHDAIPGAVAGLVLLSKLLLGAKLSAPSPGDDLQWTGLAPRIFFIFPPFLREGGGGVRGEGGIPLKSEENGGLKGGERRGRCRKRVRAFFGGRDP